MSVPAVAAMHAEQSYGCVWSDGPLFLNAGAALAVDSGTFLWAAPEVSH